MICKSCGLKLTSIEKKESGERNKNRILQKYFIINRTLLHKIQSYLNTFFFLFTEIDKRPQRLCNTSISH